MRLIGILFISIIYALAEELPEPTTNDGSADLSALFDRDDSTVWVASSSLVTITIEPEECFDELTFVSSGEHERDVERVVIHQDTPYGWAIASNEVSPCTTEDSQIVKLENPVCASKVQLTFYSCTLQHVGLRELTLRYVNKDSHLKRAVQACTSDMQCATQIGLRCDTAGTGLCTLQCVTHADCSDPTKPQCIFSTGLCGAGCMQNSDCAHIPSAPYCNLANNQCWPNMCIPRNGNNDCINPKQPVCDSSDGFCIALCTTNNDCSTYPGKVYTCQVSTGQCIFSCRSSLDCVAGAGMAAIPGPVLNGLCDTTMVPSQCVQCKTSTDCYHLWGPYSDCDLTKGCVYRPCWRDIDCTDPLNSQCSAGACVPCSTNDNCAQFSVLTACGTYGPGVQCVKPCMSDFDCLYDPTTGAALPLATATAASQCSAGICVPCDGDSTDNSCAIFTDVYNMQPYRCSSGTCAPVQCLDNDDCTSTTASVCDMTTFTCKPCAGNNDCAQFGFTVVCLLNVCVDAPSTDGTLCVTHTDCILPATPVCVFGSCVAQCGIIPHACFQFFSEKFCSTDGTCKTPLCIHNEDCWSTPATPICASPDSGLSPPTCVATCMKNSDCQSYSVYDDPVCSNGACVKPACRLDVDCQTAALPTCDPLNFVCVAKCNNNAQCTKFYDTQLCDVPSGTCVHACERDEDCLEPNFPKCNYRTTTLQPMSTIRGCVSACQNQREPCSQFFYEYLCDGANTGHCIFPECFQQSDCTNPSLPSCSTSTFKCTTFNSCNGAPDAISGIIEPLCFQFQEATLCAPNTDTMAGGFICIIPECRVDTDCKDPALPLCTLGECVDDCRMTKDLCARFADTSFCRPDPDEKTMGHPCAAPECRDNADCGPPPASLMGTASPWYGAYDKSRCDQTNRICLGCLSDDDCQYWAADSFPGTAPSFPATRVSAQGSLQFNQVGCFAYDLTLFVAQGIVDADNTGDPGFCGVYCSNGVDNTIYFAVADLGTYIHCYCANPLTMDPSGTGMLTASGACITCPGGGNCGTTNSIYVYQVQYAPSNPLAPLYVTDTPNFKQTGCYLLNGPGRGYCVPRCESNIDCLRPSAPICTTVGFCDKGCASNLDCAQFTTEFWCSLPSAGGTGQCIKPVCVTNQDCKDPTLGRCDTTGPVPVCSGCMTDDDCSQFVGQFTCDKVQSPSPCIRNCHDNFDCKDPNYPVCNQCDDSIRGTPCLNPGVPYACQPLCKTNDDCSQFYWTPICQYDPATGIGVCRVPGAAAALTCVDNRDCPNPATPFCDITTPGGVCTAGCMSHADCTRYHADSRAKRQLTFQNDQHWIGVVKGWVWCDSTVGQTTSGQCVFPDCVMDSDCPDPLLPKCVDPGTGAAPTCQPACANQNDCARFAYSSYCTGGRCVAPVCDENDQCPPEAPVCQTATLALLSVDPTVVQPRGCFPACTSHDQCAQYSWAYKTWCNSGSCVRPECINNYDCLDPTLPVCVIPGDTLSQPTCQAVCATNADCVQFSKGVVALTGGTLGTTWCDATATKTCVVPACLENFHCKDPNNPICDTSGLVMPLPFCTTGCTTDDQCTRFSSLFDGVWVCRMSICVAPQCLQNVDCPAATPLCDLTANPPQCALGCADNADCSHFAAEKFCIVAAGDPNVGACVAPNCKEDVDCPATAPHCDNTVVPPTCVAKCANDNECVQYAQQLLCIAGVCTKPACLTDADCTNPTPACDLGLRTCKECTLDMHCGAGTVCNTHQHKCVTCVRKSDCGAGMTCLVKAHKCVVCVDDTDCNLRTDGLIACNVAKNTCVACNSDAQCGGSTPACDLTTFKCVTCLENEHCPGNTVCNQGTRTCVECATNSDCFVLNPAGFRACNTASQTCVDCLTDSDCVGKAGRPACHVASKTCIACTTDAHCPGQACHMGRQQCVQCTASEHCGGSPCDVSSNTCTQCLIDSDCMDPTLPACDLATLSCIECASSDNCAGRPGKTACDVANQVCVQCTTDDHCAGNPAAPACDVSTHTCVGCQTNSHCETGTVCETASATCVACLADKDCPGLNSHCLVNNNAYTCVQCSSDSHCNGTTPVCSKDKNVCLGCVLSSDCWFIDFKTPICREDNTCGPCKTDGDCVANFIAFQACDIDTGRCVPDQYRKGFYISAVVLGSIAIFLTAGALLAIFLGAAGKD